MEALGGAGVCSYKTVVVKTIDDLVDGKAQAMDLNGKSCPTPFGLLEKMRDEAIKSLPSQPSFESGNGESGSISFEVVDYSGVCSSRRGRDKSTVNTHNIVTWTEMDDQLWILQCSQKRLICLGGVGERSAQRVLDLCVFAAAIIGGIEAEAVWRGFCQHLPTPASLIQKPGRKLNVTFMKELRKFQARAGLSSS
jgi:hypothetical protein